MPEKNIKNIKIQKIISLSLVVIGILGSGLALLYPKLPVIMPELFFGLIYLVVPFGLGWYALTNGRSIAWGLATIFTFVGPLVVLIGLAYRPNPPVKPYLSWRNIIGFILLIGFFGLIMGPLYTRYIMRVRTQDAIDHARTICNAMTDWISAPNMADGDPVNYPVPPVTTPGKDGHTFLEQFPTEAGWLAAADKTSPGADSFYGFTLDLSNPSNPVVMGRVRSDEDGGYVMGRIVQAGGTGVESGDDLAGCKVNIEKYSARF